ncbi:puttaive FtsX-family transport protein [Streptococcus pneumoniae]|nr:puttaive FtsX-family transport protein [Streptococcus pneumoniae]
MVAGLTNGELIVPMTYEETMTSDFFEAWFQKFFLPTLTTPSVIGKEAIKHLESPFGMNMSNITIDGQEMDLSQTMPSYAQVVSLYEDTSISVSSNETDKVLAGSLYTDTNEQGLTIPSSLLKNWNEQTGKNLTANDLIGKSVSASIIESAAEIRSILCFLNREFLIL